MLNVIIIFKGMNNLLAEYNVETFVPNVESFLNTHVRLHKTTVIKS